MEKLKIKIPLLLPEVPDEKDQCVQKLLNQLKDKETMLFSPKRKEKRRNINNNSYKSKQVINLRSLQPVFWHFAAVA